MRYIAVLLFSVLHENWTLLNYSILFHQSIVTILSVFLAEQFRYKRERALIVFTHGIVIICGWIIPIYLSIHLPLTQIFSNTTWKAFSGISKSRSCLACRLPCWPSLPSWSGGWSTSRVQTSVHSVPCIYCDGALAGWHWITGSSI